MREESVLYALGLAQGKTTTAVEAAYRLKLKRVLIVAPRNTYSGWERTVRRQYQDYTDPMLVRWINSTVPGKQAMQDFWNGVPGWYFVTWQYFALRPEGFWNKTDVDMVVADECHRMQNRNSKSWANMRNVGKTNTKRVAMSGTFVGNKMQGAWTTLRWLFPEHLIKDGSYDPKYGVYGTPRSFWNWVGDWLIQVEDEWLGFTTIEGERYEEGTMLSYYDNYIHEGDDLGLEEPLVVDIECKLSPAQKKLYKQMVEEEIMWLDTPDPLTGKLPSVSELRAVTRIRLRQITLGAPAFNEVGKVAYNVDTYSSKLDEAMEVMGDLPVLEPVLVFTHSREFASVAAHRFTQRGYNAFAWIGGTSDKARADALATWGKAGGYQVIVAVVEAIAEGTDGLQDLCSTEFWFSDSDNLFMNTQAKGRLPRPSTVRSERVTRYRFIVPGTYDQEIIDKQLAKRLSLNNSLGSQTKGNHST